MARAITAPELALLRSDGQFSRLGMMIYKPETIMTATVSGFVASGSGTYDQVDTLYLSGSSGVNPEDGQTMYVSSGSTGGYDEGMVRVRSVNGNTIFIGETSSIAWTAGSTHITVVDDYQLWSRRLRMWGGSWVIDGLTLDDSYTNYEPVPVLGPQVAVLELSGSSVSFTPSAADSWVIDSTIASYRWTVSSGSISIANETTATPTVTCTGPGTYRLSCWVTAANGKYTAGRRLVHCYASGSPQVSQFTLDQCSGEWDGGGWSFSVTMYDQAQSSLVVDRALCCVYAKDYYGSSGSIAAQSIGPVSGYENIICLGWIDGESITWNPQQSSVKFTVQGAGGWLDKISGYPASVTDMQAAPGVTPNADWPWMPDLTADKALWHMVHWRSTADRIIDVFPTGDTRRWYAASAPSGTLRSQIDNFMNIRILAKPVCDRYGRLFSETDAQYLLVANRTTIPVVMDITKPDWKDEVGITRQTSSKTAMLDADALFWNSSSGAFEAVIGRANGDDMRQLGGVRTKSSLAANDQTDCNDWAGLLIGRDNNEYPVVALTLAANNRMLDIAPRQYATLTLAAGDTPRGVSFTAKKFLPRSVSFEMDKKSGQITTALQLEAETFPELSTTVYRPPIVRLDKTPTPTPEPRPNPRPSCGGDAVSPRPTVASGCRTSATYPANGPFYATLTGTVLGGESIYTYMPSWVRMASADNLTKMQLRAQFQKSLDSGSTWVDETSWTPYTVAAYDANCAVIATGSWISGSAPASGMNSKYSQLVINGSGSASGGDVEGYKVTVADHGTFVGLLGSGETRLPFPSTGRHAIFGKDNFVSEVMDGGRYIHGLYEGYYWDSTAAAFQTTTAWFYYAISPMSSFLHHTITLVNNQAAGPEWFDVKATMYSRATNPPAGGVTDTWIVYDAGGDLYSGALARTIVVNFDTYPTQGASLITLELVVEASFFGKAGGYYGNATYWDIYDDNGYTHRAIINESNLYNACQHA